jgi:hypothetical protein
MLPISVTAVIFAGSSMPIIAVAGSDGETAKNLKQNAKAIIVTVGKAKTI